MTTTTTAAATRPRGRALDRARVLLALGCVLGVGAVGTLAAWTDDATATSGSFSTGSVDLKLGTASSTSGADALAFTTFTASALKPGSVVDASLKVYNAGTLPVTYTLASAVGTGGSSLLAAAVGVTVYDTTCGGTVVSAGGSTLSSTSLAAARPLAAGASETLCFRATLPSGAASTLQGLTTTATFTFTGTNT